MVAPEFPGAVTGKNPRSFSPGRPYGKLIWVIIHSTEGSEDDQAAENGNAYDARRTDGTSTHVFVDRNSVVQEVNSWDRAHAALAVGNNRGYQVELCGRAAQSALQWKDAQSGPALEAAARHVAYVCREYGIPPRWCTKADVDARRPGLLTHAMVTDWLAGTHTDPGKNFPFGWFVGRVGYYLSQFNPPPAPPPTPVPVVPTKNRRTAMLVQQSGKPEVWCVVPGQGRYWVTAETYPSHSALYGKPVIVPDPADFGPEIPAPGETKVTKKLASSAALYDGQVDNPELDTEHTPGVGPQ